MPFFPDYGNINGTETLQVRGKDREGRPSGETFQCTTQQIAALGGGGGYLFSIIVTNGTTATVDNVGTFLGFNSVTSGAKTVTIPDSIGSKETITVADMAGDAGDNNITVQTESDQTIFGLATVYSDSGSITLFDSQAGWVSI